MSTFVYDCKKCKAINCAQMPLKDCKWCSGKLKIRVTHVSEIAPGGYVKKTVMDFKTIGEVADFNTDRMSDEERKLHGITEDDEAKKRRILSKATKKQKEDYVERGIVPVPSDESALGVPLTDKVKKKRIKEHKEDIRKRKYKK